MVTKGGKVGGINQEFGINTHTTMASLMAEQVKNLPSMQETRIRSLGPEDPLEKEMVTHSNILA